MDHDSPSSVAAASGRSARAARGPALIIGLAVIILAGAALAYMGWRAAQPHPTPIGEILADLRRYDEQSVLVKGTVSNASNIILFKVYDLTDDSGTIKVVTARGLPGDGDVVEVRGIVNQLFQLGTASATVIMEPNGSTT